MTSTDAQTAGDRGPGSPTAIPLAVDLRGVFKNFGAVEAVRGLDLAIRPGEVMAFLGPNGAGKTSTIDMILGLSRPSAGDRLLTADRHPHAPSRFPARTNFTVASKAAVKEVSLQVVDGPFATGTGPLVEGTTLALIMAMAGRTAYHQDLTGPGVSSKGATGIA